MPTLDQATTALIGVFHNREQAEQFVADLRQAGFPDHQIGIVSPHATSASPGDGATVGAITGGTVGALAGLAVAAGLIPGIGPVLAGGILAAIVASTATGAAAGGVLGALLSLGIPEEEARRYEQELLAGRTLVVVQGETRLPEALAILRRYQQA